MAIEKKSGASPEGEPSPGGMKREIAGYLSRKDRPAAGHMDDSQSGKRRMSERGGKGRPKTLPATSGILPVLRHRKVGHHPLNPDRSDLGKSIKSGRKILGQKSQTPHPGIDFDMDSQGRALGGGELKGSDLIGVMNDGSQKKTSTKGNFFGRETSKKDNLPLKTTISKMASFVDAHDSHTGEAVESHRLGNRNDPVAIGVRFDDREKVHPQWKGLSDRPDIFEKTSEIDGDSAARLWKIATGEAEGGGHGVGGGKSGRKDFLLLFLRMFIDLRGGSINKLLDLFLKTLDPILRQKSVL